MKHTYGPERWLSAKKQFGGRGKWCQWIYSTMHFTQLSIRHCTVWFLQILWLWSSRDLWEWNCGPFSLTYHLTLWWTEGSVPFVDVWTYIFFNVSCLQKVHWYFLQWGLHSSLWLFLLEFSFSWDGLTCGLKQATWKGKTLILACLFMLPGL